MRIGVIGFTAGGARIAGRLKRGLSGYGHEVSAFAVGNCLGELKDEERCGIEPLEMPLKEWTHCFFGGGNGLIFVGAAGIAVRSVAPFLRGKAEDPAVAVADETGRYVISLLSGHLGGANDLARQAAAVLGAEPVITTATDLNRVFAVDLFAKKNDLAIVNLDAVKRVSSELLKGNQVGLISDFPIEGEVPEGLTPGRRQSVTIQITVKAGVLPRETVLLLIPRAVSMGIGCRKGVAREDVERAANEAMRAGGLNPLALRAAASIDIKRDEKGLLLFAGERKIPLFFYTAKELGKLEGNFTGSDFVLRVAGVENVCERAAVRCCEENFAYLAAGKTVAAGVTAAAAVERRTLRF